MLVRVPYVSVINDRVSKADIERIVATSQRRNRQRDLTGALTVCDGHFAQLLEGEEIHVEETMRKIAVDARHRDIVVRDRSFQSKRLFGSWDMAFIDQARCENDVRELLAQRCTVEQFIGAMAAWIEDEKTAPVARAHSR
jgi:hypothetical protein